MLNGEIRILNIEYLKIGRRLSYTHELIILCDS